MYDIGFLEKKRYDISLSDDQTPFLVKQNKLYTLGKRKQKYKF